LKIWWPGTELNRRRQPFQGCALPPELPGHFLNALQFGLEKSRICHVIIRPPAGTAGNSANALGLVKQKIIASRCGPFPSAARRWRLKDQFHRMKLRTVQVKAGAAVRKYRVVISSGPEDLVFQSALKCKQIPTIGEPLRDERIHDGPCKTLSNGFLGCAKASGGTCRRLWEWRNSIRQSLAPWQS
jgi:hypothetical protein